MHVNVDSQCLVKNNIWRKVTLEFYRQRKVRSLRVGKCSQHFFYKPLMSLVSNTAELRVFEFWFAVRNHLVLDWSKPRRQSLNATGPSSLTVT